VAAGGDPRVVEVVLREAIRIVRMDRGIIIAQTRHGFVCANAGVDASNVPPGQVVVLPPDPDTSAGRLRHQLLGLLGVPVAVVISDTFGRPWREGLVNVAIGMAGIAPLESHVGSRDTHGRTLQATVIAVADEVASAAELVMGKTAGTPVAVVKGVRIDQGEKGARPLIRAAEHDMFR